MRKASPGAKGYEKGLAVGWKSPCGFSMFERKKRAYVSLGSASIVSLVEWQSEWGQRNPKLEGSHVARLPKGKEAAPTRSVSGSAPTPRYSVQ